MIDVILLKIGLGERGRGIANIPSIAKCLCELKHGESEGKSRGNKRFQLKTAFDTDQI